MAGKSYRACTDGNGVAHTLSSAVSPASFAAFTPPASSGDRSSRNDSSACLPADAALWNVVVRSAAVISPPASTTALNAASGALSKNYH